jgi:hypothetical protein
MQTHLLFLLATNAALESILLLDGVLALTALLVSLEIQQGCLSVMSVLLVRRPILRLPSAKIAALLSIPTRLEAAAV